MRYRFIESFRQRWPIAPMCRVLGVSRSGYYAWRTRPESQRGRDNRLLAVEIKAIHEEIDGKYGSPRMTLALKARGIRCSENRVARIMREYGIRAKRSRRFKATTNSGHELPTAPNLLDRNFEAEGPNQVWATDITYIPTDEGWLYLAVVLDLWSRRIVGWSLRSRMTQRLVIEALKQAIDERKPDAGPIAHSDRGSQYCSAAYRSLLERHGMAQSMARKGDCWDNAPVESFFSTLKLECIYPTRYKTRQQARRDIFAYIEAFYNTRRIHTSIENQSPAEYEELMSSA
jgi:transposase InsO family protein